MSSRTATRTTKTSQFPAVFPPENLYYLAHGLPFNRLTVSQLRAILVTHEIALPPGDKSKVVETCEKYVAGNRGGILRKWTTREKSVKIAVGETWAGESNDSQDECDKGGAEVGVEMLQPDNELTAALMGEEWYYLAPGFDVGVLKKNDVQEIVEKHDLQAEGMDTKKKLVLVWEQHVNAIRDNFVRKHLRAVAGVKAGLSSGGSPGHVAMTGSPRGVDAVGETSIDDDESDVQSEPEIDAAYPSPPPSSPRLRGGRGPSQAHSFAPSQPQSKRGKAGEANQHRKGSVPNGIVNGGWSASRSKKAGSTSQSKGNTPLKKTDGKKGKKASALNDDTENSTTPAAITIPLTGTSAASNAPIGGGTKEPGLTALALRLERVESWLEKTQQGLVMERILVKTLIGRIVLLEARDSLDADGASNVENDEDDEDFV